MCVKVVRKSPTEALERDDKLIDQVPKVSSVATLSPVWRELPTSVPLFFSPSLLENAPVDNGSVFFLLL